MAAGLNDPARNRFFVRPLCSTFHDASTPTGVADIGHGRTHHRLMSPTPDRGRSAIPSGRCLLPAFRVFRVLRGCGVASVPAGWDQAPSGLPDQRNQFLIFDTAWMM